MDAYLTGLEQARQNGVELSAIRSVASFFVSRVDTEIDKRLDKIGTDEAQALRGKAGIANARLAYEAFEEVFAGDRWQALEGRRRAPAAAALGVHRRQGPELRRHHVRHRTGRAEHREHDAGGDPGSGRRPRRRSGATTPARYDEAREVLEQLAELGIEVDEVTELLEVEGVQKFEDSWSVLLEGVQQQLTAAKG